MADALRKAGITAKESSDGKQSEKERFSFDDEDYMLAVEAGDMDAAQKMVDEAAQKSLKNSAVKRDGKLLKMFHGTSEGGYTVFDTYDGKFGLFGKDSYFTDNKEVAASYTEKGHGTNKQVYAVYLDIKAPIDMDAKADVQTWKKAF